MFSEEITGPLGHNACLIKIIFSCGDGVSGKVTARPFRDEGPEPEGPFLLLLLLECDLHFGFSVETSSQAEIAYLDRHILREEHVAEFQVSVDDPVGVNVS